MSRVDAGRSRTTTSFAARGLSALSGLAVAGLLAAAAIAPQSAATASGSADAGSAQAATQELDVIVAAQIADDARDTFGGESKPVVVPAAPAARSVAPAAARPADPATAQGVGYAALQARGWGDDQWGCLVALWNKESHWNVYAGNQSSGAYGIPQAVPGSKMAAAGPNWQSDPATQIAWGLSYIAGRYGDPCGAWAHSQASNWY